MPLLLTRSTAGAQAGPVLLAAAAAAAAAAMVMVMLMVIVPAGMALAAAAFMVAVAAVFVVAAAAAAAAATTTTTQMRRSASFFVGNTVSRLLDPPPPPPPLRRRRPPSTSSAPSPPPPPLPAFWGLGRCRCFPDQSMQFRLWAWWGGGEATTGGLGGKEGGRGGEYGEGGEAVHDTANGVVGGAEGEDTARFDHPKKDQSNARSDACPAPLATGPRLWKAEEEEEEEDGSAAARGGGGGGGGGDLFEGANLGEPAVVAVGDGRGGWVHKVRVEMMPVGLVGETNGGGARHVAALADRLRTMSRR